MKLSGISKQGMQRLAQDMESGYQGFTNYETWVVALWLDNDQGSYEYWQERKNELVSEVGGDALHELAGALKADHEESMPELEGVWGDLLNGALSEVNWREIAEHLMSE